MLEHLANTRYGQSGFDALICVGRSVFRSVNDSGPDGLATVGCGLAVGSPKGEAPAARATQLCKLSPSSSGDHEANVQSEGSAPRVNHQARRTGPPRVRLRPLGSGPMSFARDLTKGHQQTYYRRLHRQTAFRGLTIWRSGILPEKFGDLSGRGVA